MTEAQGTQVITLLTNISTQLNALGMVLSNCLVHLQVLAALIAALVFWSMQRK